MYSSFIEEIHKLPKGYTFGFKRNKLSYFRRLPDFLKPCRKVGAAVVEVRFFICRKIVNGFRCLRRFERRYERCVAAAAMHTAVIGAAIV